jgi:hypothetical protein
MKPRPSAPWTMEDVVIWRRFALHPLSVWRYVYADRADAKIMYDIGVSAHLRLDFADGYCAWLLPRFRWPLKPGFVYPDGHITNCG